MDEEDSEYDDLLSKGLSNSWAVHGNYTDSGSPLMANDFHMGANLP
jgi:acyl-homoserine lactone acylase PvdQ